MNNYNKYYIEKINESFALKKRINSSYSLRAYSKFLGMHSSTLSQVLSGKRGLSLKSALDIIEKLKLRDKEKERFIESISQRSSLDKISIASSGGQHLVDNSQFHVIAEWEHFAVLSLFKIKNSKIDLNDIMLEFSINEKRAEEVINNLISANLIKKQKNHYLRITEAVKTTEDVNSLALVHCHLENLEIAKQKLESVDIMLRDFSAVMLNVDTSKLPELKKLIREFRKKLAVYCQDMKADSVYQVAIQLYPLSDKKKKE